MRLALGSRMLLCGFVWAACLASAAQAQRLSSIVSAVTPRPELESFARQNAYRPQLSRDGTRIFVVQQGLGDPSVQSWSVLDTRTGATIASAPTLGGLSRPAAAMSPDGRTVAFAVLTGPASSELRIRDVATGVDTTRLTGTAGLAVEALTDSGVVGYWLDGALLIATPGAAPFALQNPCAPPPAGTSESLSGPIHFSADGRQATYHRVWAQPVTIIRNPSAHFFVDSVTLAIETRVARCVTTDVAPPLTGSTAAWPTGGAEVVINSRSGPVALDTERRLARALWPARDAASTLDVSEDGRYVLVHRYTDTGGELSLLDRTTGVVEVVAPATNFDATVSLASLSADGGTVTFATSRPMPGGPPVVSMSVATLDVDHDAIHDAWERAFGFDPSTGADASLDADGDGLTNLQEFAAGTHPRGVPVRHFAEGAHGDFFAVSVALFNPGSTAADVNVRFLGIDGATASYPLSLPALGTAYLDAADVALPSTEFGLVVEGAASIVTERRMTWDRTAPYGSHSANGVDVPSTTWHFAEGATIAGFQTFFLLQNSADTPATALVRYLLANGTTEERQHVVPARSRITVWANQEGGPMGAAEFGTTIISDLPIVTERAMYRDAPGGPFAAGSVASGVAAPATSWFFAEGATGAFFDTFLLLANPGDAAAAVDVEFLRAQDPSPRSYREVTTAVPITKHYVVAPQSRRTIWIRQEDPALVDAEVGARLQLSVPIVAERTMWWPGPTAATWRESHAEIGATTSGQRWAVADMQVDTQPDGWDTFLLVATTQQAPADVRVAVSCEDGSGATRDIGLSVRRTTLWMRHEFPQTVGRRCAATVESLRRLVGLSQFARAPIVVEKAMYLGSDFRAGGATLGTRLPDPPD